MTNAELIAKIKVEIEKLKTFYGELHTDFVCEKLLSFLDTLESENPMNQDELEDEMDRYFETMPVLEHENIFDCTFQNIARHFAKWGSEHAKK